MKALLKNSARAVFLVLACPVALLAGLGRYSGGFLFGAHLSALIPGLPGDYFRAAFYAMTLRQFPQDSRISFGAFFSTSDVIVGHHVYIGSYCVIGRARIGDNAQIASHVQILSGRRQHIRDEKGAISGGDQGVFDEVTIGHHTWIGAAAVVMANVGERTTVGAGAIVVKDLPSDVVAVGNPAKVIRMVQSPVRQTTSL